MVRASFQQQLQHMLLTVLALWIPLIPLLFLAQRLVDSRNGTRRAKGSSPNTPRVTFADVAGEKGGHMQGMCQGSWAGQHTCTRPAGSNMTAGLCPCSDKQHVLVLYRQRHTTQYSPAVPVSFSCAVRQLRHAQLAPCCPPALSLASGPIAVVPVLALNC